MGVAMGWVSACQALAPQFGRRSVLACLGTRSIKVRTQGLSGRISEVRAHGGGLHLRETDLSGIRKDFSTLPMDVRAGCLRQVRGPSPLGQEEGTGTLP